VSQSGDKDAEVPSPRVGEGDARQETNGHTREGGYPVIASDSEEIEQLGVLDHPPSRMMTTEVAATSRQ
jgi:hypothetical protein